MDINMLVDLDVWCVKENRSRLKKIAKGDIKKNEREEGQKYIYTTC